MAAMLASIALGFDVRISNTTAIHPRLQGAEAASTSSTAGKPDVYVAPKRDAYHAAVRDSFISPEGEYSEYSYRSSSGYAHNTFHGVQMRHRPAVTDIPIRFTESADNQSFYTQSEGSRTPSINRSPSPRKSSRSDSVTTADMDMALISLSPSTDKAFVDYQRQMSETSSVFETPKTTPKTTPQRSVQFEDSLTPSPTYHRRSPSNTSNISIPSVDAHNEPYPAILPPPRKQSSVETHHGTPERPVTLDITPRPRPQPSGILKKSPAHHALVHSSPRGRVTPTPTTSIGRVTPTPSESVSTNADDSLSFYSAHSGTSMGSPPRLPHQRSLLDMDVGQGADPTQPIPAKATRTPPSATMSERFFLT